MSESFSAKLAFVLKALSMSRARLAAELGVDKSVVGRWVTGAVKPSAHNLALLSALLAQRVPGFTALDWERDPDGLAALLGVEPGLLTSAHPLSRTERGVPLPFMGQILAATALRGAAYEGFYRSTRPWAANPGSYVHDHCWVRKDESGLLRLNMATGGVFVDGWVLPLHSQLFIIGAEFTSGVLVFSILHGVNTVKAEVLDGITLSPILDAGRTLTASTILLERIADLSGDPVADEARFADLASLHPAAPEGSVPAKVRAHLAREIGPAELARGGDWLLRLPLSRSWSRGESPP